MTTEELQKIAKVLGKLENKIAYVTCPYKHPPNNLELEKVFGPCGKPSNCIFVAYCVVIPCENHAKEYEKERNPSWEKYRYD
jgi:hypothetical protein